MSRLRLGMAFTHQLHPKLEHLACLFGICSFHGFECIELHDRASQVLGKAIVDFAAYQMPFVVAGIQHVPQDLQGLLLLVDVAGHMDAADNLPRLVPQGTRSDKEIAAEAIIMHFGGVRLRHRPGLRVCGQNEGGPLSP